MQFKIGYRNLLHGSDFLCVLVMIYFKMTLTIHDKNKDTIIFSFKLVHVSQLTIKLYLPTSYLRSICDICRFSKRQYRQLKSFRLITSFTPRLRYQDICTCSVVLTFESVNKILWCDHSNETSLALLLLGTTCFSILKKKKMKFGIFLEF